ncbi:MAG: hypothetical protein U5K37_08180 [Natrialbaceae archaeon]|nr:hypothetical protein [Natrialbaceae archaeon]
MNIDHPLIHFGVLEWGYGWVFPNSDRYVVGVGGLNHENEQFRSLLEAYLEQLGFEPAKHVAGHPIPFGNYIDDPSAGCVLLVGDAAGMADPITGEGVLRPANRRAGRLGHPSGSDGWA